MHTACIFSIKISIHLKHEKVYSSYDDADYVLYNFPFNNHYLISEVVSTIKTTWVSVKVLKPPLQDIIMRLVQRGSRVYVGGKLENWRYISKEDGSIHFFTVVIAGK